jgi:very-short-patch-repair endonuclease
VKIVGNTSEQTLAYQLKADGIKFEQNYRFSPARKFELDVAIPEHRIGVEIDGGVYTRQAHGSVSGIKRDMEKHNLLTLQGWRVLRFLPDEVKRGEAIQGIKDLLSFKNNEKDI